MHVNTRRLYSNENKEYIKNHYKTTKYSEIAAVLGRSTSAITQFCKVNGLQKNGSLVIKGAELVAVRRGRPPKKVAGSRFVTVNISGKSKIALLNLSRVLRKNGFEYKAA